MEAPTGYLTGHFTRIRSLDSGTWTLVTYTNRKPVVMSTPDQRHAMGVYSPPGQDSDLFMYYGAHSFPSHTSPAATNKWNVVYRKHTFAPGSTHVLTYEAYVCVGSVSDVVSCLRSLMERHENLIG